MTPEEALKNARLTKRLIPEAVIEWNGNLRVRDVTAEDLADWYLRAAAARPSQPSQPSGPEPSASSR